MVGVSGLELLRREPISFEKIIQKLNVNKNVNLTNVVQSDDKSNDKLLISN